ncbi:anti-sigma factor [Chitinophaga flava]|uniref:anti-sigma factor n=1 Tax=Chitinophaga flava TaxID=2259036 RepID=UPI00137A8C25|nr:anti-sigma factor [Chitinophaga flava]
MNIQAYISSGALESYVFGLATPEVRSEVEQLRLLYPEVNAAIIQLQHEVENFVATYAVAPPAGLKDKVLTIITQAHTDSDISHYFSIDPAPSSNYVTIHHYWRIAAVSIIILCFAFLSSAIILAIKYKSLSQKNEIHNRALYQQLAANPDVSMIQLKSSTSDQNCSITLFWNKHTGALYALADYLPTPPNQLQFQVWAVVDNKPVNAGLMKVDNSFQKLINIPHADLFWITLEKTGGSIAPHKYNIIATAETK